LQNSRFWFDFLSSEKESLLKEIRIFHTKLICGLDSPPVGAWDYSSFPPVVTLDCAQMPFDSILNLSAGSLSRVESVVTKLPL